MRVFIIFALYIVAVCAISPTSADDVQKYMTECLIENGLDPGLIGNRNKDARRPTVDEEGCVVACMNKKMGLMRQDGTFDEDVIFASAKTPEMRSEMKREFDKLLKKCKAEAGNNVCKLAGCIGKQPWDYYL